MLDPTVLDDLAGLRELGGFLLRQTGLHALRDRFWDTPARELRNRSLGLRIRQDGELAYFTLKGPAEVEGGLFRREEVEIEATAEGWSIVRGRLVENGISLPRQELPGGEPSDWLARGGFQLTQDRTTERRKLLAEVAGRQVVELALDTTTYRVGPYDVIFREIEAEALTPEIDHVLRLGAALHARFGHRVTPSRRGKYARGLEITEKLTATD